MRDEMKDEAAFHTVQTVVKTGIDRIELRDEILVQLLRQTNDNPEPEALRQAWVLMCLCTAAFSPSKNLHKVSSRPATQPEAGQVVFLLPFFMEVV